MFASSINSYNSAQAQDIVNTSTAFINNLKYADNKKLILLNFYRGTLQISYQLANQPSYLQEQVFGLWVSPQGKLICDNQPINDDRSRSGDELPLTAIKLPIQQNRLVDISLIEMDEQPGDYQLLLTIEQGVVKVLKVELILIKLSKGSLEVIVTLAKVLKNRVYPHILKSNIAVFYR